MNISISSGVGYIISVTRTRSPSGAPQGYLYNGSAIFSGDVLFIECHPMEGYRIVSAKINGSSFQGGISITVNQSVSVQAAASVITHRFTKSVSNGATVSAFRIASPLGGGPSGEVYSDISPDLYHGDYLRITAEALDGYSIESMSINGVPYTNNPYAIEVNSPIQLVIIAVPSSLVFVDSGSSIEKFKLFIDSGSVIEQYQAMIDTGSEIVPY